MSILGTTKLGAAKLRAMKPFHRAAIGLAATAVLGTSGWAAYDSVLAHGQQTECFLRYEPDDARQVAFSAADVFRGRIVDHDGPELLDQMPVDTYEVEVQDRYKGDLRDTVTVIHPRNFQDRLKPGASYVFATEPWAGADGEYGGAGHAILPGTVPPAAPDADDGSAATAAHWRRAVAHAVDPESLSDAVRRPARAGR
ncbi:hypothetical protein OG897_16430 [Streptomyces sp. NBC_00237]|uniref:hypothetical protein n=1 Tax=Streptomyces sp. NBC_00237 TaxID=2975687 RepID=UPI0022577A2C|nr:hypothetical protein [Streptomyces sp. NBC_00237]MCX5203029.1 hypothetical protein [Streptomyces sp. NBC_00237]